MNESYTLADELDRKTLDALASILTQVSEGVASRAEADFGLRILFQAVSGIVSGEAFDLMSKASKELQEYDRTSVRRVLLKPPEVVLIEYQFGEPRLTLKRGELVHSSVGHSIQWHIDKVASYEHEINPFEAAHARFKGYSDVLLRQGFIEVL